MKTVGFIGAYDKSDLITYIAKILVSLNKKVLVIDTTILQRTKYIVPSISPTKSYVTDFEEIDVAVGFESYNEIKEYLGLPQHAAFTYDYILIDADTSEAIEKFEVKSANSNYFVTGFDSYSLKRGLEILSDLSEPMPLKRILFSKNITEEESVYLEYISLGAKAIWDDEKIYFPFEQGDQTVIIENQMVSKIKFRKLTELYKESLIFIAEELVEDKKEKTLVRKVFKQLEKGA